MSQATIHVFDTPHLAVQAAGDAFMEGMADIDSKIAGLSAHQKCILSMIILSLLKISLAGYAHNAVV